MLIRTVGAVLLEEEGKPSEWACYSVGVKDVLIRKRSPTGWEEQRLTHAEFSELRSLTRSELLGIDWPKESYQECDLRAADEAYPVWNAFLSSLDGVSGITRANRVVPIGPLRRAYLDLKNTKTPPEGWEGLSIEQQADWIADAWRQSIDLMAPYDNSKEGWTDSQANRIALPVSPELLAEVRSDREFVSWATASAGITFDDSDTPSYLFVDREINPVRTTQSTCEDGTPADATGSGGMDLLLIDADRQPVVGEVKVRDDSDLRYALFQALAYASELATVNQLLRLKRWRPEYFDAVDPLQAEVGILLIQVERPRDDLTEDSTAQLISVLNERKLPRLGPITAVASQNGDWRTVA